MAYKSVYKRTDHSVFYRSSLLNGDVPGRKSKAYNVTYFHGSVQPSRVYTEWWDGATSVDYVSMLGVDVGWPNGIDRYVYDPSAHPNAGEAFSGSASKLASSVDKARDTGLNAAVFIAELPSTVKMFVSTARRVTTAFKAVKQGNLSKAAEALGVQPPRGRNSRKGVGRRTADAVANNWLELKYGWLPLLSDLDSAAHKVASSQFQARTACKGTASVSDTVVEVLPSGGTATYYRELRVEQGLTYKVVDELIAHAASLGFTNPMLLAWETLPLSFVFDWFYSVGDWLQGFSRYHGLEFVDGYITRSGVSVTAVSYPGSTLTVNRGFEISPGVYGSRLDYRRVTSGGSVYARASGFHRAPMVEFPSNDLPRIDFKPSLAKLATAMSLIQQRRG